MKTNFMCPKCRGYLGVDNKVIFCIKTKGWEGGLLMLTPELGDYTSLHHPSFSFKENDDFDFYCPICGYDLSVDGEKRLAKVILKEDNDKEYYVIFSKIKGEQCTYKVANQKVEGKFGKDADKHINVLNLSAFK
ncbi:MAG TPA: hypothetical protein VFC87_00185 [Perlabentimonas sp.]|nr:hypothetical protein [Bacteroidales bacterium]MDD4672722.1 hypothetical protein [Bacteroidales bacterium]MDY0347428.1 hypothetical protein [Tenuifilaceae bacterium]HZJ73193.1 hypothetical protein [Perlabentimonas sp.]